jgi:hypothetical protein
MDDKIKSKCCNAKIKVESTGAIGWNACSKCNSKLSGFATIGRSKTPKEIAQQARLEALRECKQALEKLKEDNEDRSPSDQIVGFMYCIEAIDNLITQTEND